VATGVAELGLSEGREGLRAIRSFEMRRRTLLLGVGSSALVVGLLAVVQPARLVASAMRSQRATHQLAFSGSSPDSLDLYLVRADGTGFRRLTRTPNVNEAQPSWSPAGTVLAFDRFSDYGATHHLSLLTLGARQARILVAVPGAGGYADPSWSPDGRWIVFSDNSDASGFSRGGIYVVSRRGTQLRKIPGTSNDDSAPSWSPDGRLIAFANAKDGIVVVNADGSSRRQLTDSPGDNTPVWSPKGRLVAFSRTDKDSNENIWVMNPNGSHQRQLTDAAPTPVGGPAGGNQPGHAIEPTWSPDGREIAYVNVPNDAGQLWVMNSDGSRQRVVRRGLQRGGDLQPSWQP
jgi:TolB protein